MKRGQTRRASTNLLEGGVRMEMRGMNRSERAGLVRATFVRVLSVGVLGAWLALCDPGLWGQTSAGGAQAGLTGTGASQATGQSASGAAGTALPVLHVENGPNSERARSAALCGAGFAGWVSMGLCEAGWGEASAGAWEAGCLGAGGDAAELSVADVSQPLHDCDGVVSGASRAGGEQLSTTRRTGRGTG
jgi:hypothetical protein